MRLYISRCCDQGGRAKMYVTATTFLIVALAGAALVEGQASCEFNLQTDLDPKKEPLVLSVKIIDIRGSPDEEEVESLSIAKPSVVNGDTGVIKVHDKKRLKIACTGSGNKIAGNIKDEDYLTCDNGKFILDGQEANVETTSCTKGYARSWMQQQSDETCGSGDDTGIVLQLGFMMNDKAWFPVIELCHNITRGVTLYESHTLAGHSIRGAEKCSDRKGFARGLKDLYPGINPDKVFSKKGQRDAFRKILGLSGYSKYVNDKTFIARGHLAPDADFIFNSEQMLTYYFANAAPQFQDFNAGNWVVVENAVRDLAAKLAMDIQVYTGQYGVLELPDYVNHKQPLYLAPDENMVPVPKVFWKMVQHPINQACTIAVGHNNIFHHNKPTPICQPKTPDGWPTLDDISKGYTYYCDYQGFAETVKFAPDIECKDLFEFPEVKSY